MRLANRSPSSKAHLGIVCNERSHVPMVPLRKEQSDVQGLYTGSATF